MYKIEVSKYILDKHKQYILQSDIISEIETLKNNSSLMKKYGQEHILFCDFLINQVNDLNNKNILEEDNLFLSKPKILNKYIEKIQRDFPNVAEVINDEKNYYNKMILSAFGYEKFSSEKMSLYYKQEEKFLKSYSKTKIKKQLQAIKGEKRKYETKHIYLLIQNIEKEIDKILSDNIRDKNIQAIFSELKCNLIILKNTVDEKKNIDEVITNIANYVNSSLKMYKKLNLNSKSINIYNYSVYKRKQPEIKWSAYDYVMELGLKVCPYCNRQYITPLYSQNAKMRADLDHFFSKAKYPYLSMSIYNLVPSCKFCNSSLKGTKEFSYEKYINPFEDSIDKYISFNYIINSYEAIYGKDDVEIILEENLNCDSKMIEKAKNNINAFDILNTYQYHSDIVKKLIKKKFIYNDSYIESIWRSYGNLFKSRDEVVEYVIKDTIENDKINQSLNKLVDDIMGDLKLKKIK